MSRNIPLVKRIVRAAHLCYHCRYHGKAITADEQAAIERAGAEGKTTRAPRVQPPTGPSARLILAELLAAQRDR